MAPQAPLETQQVEVRLGKADLKTSDKLAVPGTLAVAQNAEMTNTGRYQRRPGTNYVTTISGATRIHGGERETIVGTQSALYSNVDGVFQNRGSIAGYRGDFEPVNNTSFAQTSHDMCRVNGLDFSAWEETAGIFYAVRDSVTGAYLVEEAAVEGAGTYSRPQIIAVGTLVAIVFKDSGSIYCRRIDSATPSVLGSRTQIGTNMLSGLGNASGFDTIVKPGSTTTICVCGHSVGDAVQLAEFSVSTLTTTATKAVALSQSSTGSRSIAFLQGVTPDYVVLTAAADNVGLSVGSNIKAFTVTAGLGANGTIRVIWAGSTSAVHSITNCTGFVDGSGTWQLLIDSSGTTASARSQVWYFTRTSGGVLSGPSILFGFLLMSPVFTFGGLNVVMYSGTVQSIAGPDSTYFLAVVQTGAIVGRALPGLADDRQRDPASQPVFGHLPHVTVTSTDALVPSDYFITTTQRAACVVDFDAQPASRYLEVAGVTLIPGGSIYMYDGMGVTELGFNFPPGITAIATAVSGGLNIGTYYYRACWEWVDARGRLHRSKPSDPQALIVGSNGLRGRVTIGSLVTTLKSSPIPQAVLGLFRTTINPSSSSAAAYFRVSTVANDPTTASIVIDDVSTDAQIIVNDRLYTLGNTVLSNSSPPPANTLTAWGNRVWAAERDILWFSKTLVDTEGVAFPAENFIQVSDDRGDIVAIADSGQRIAAFKSSAIYVISGEGPNNLGVGDFSPTRRLSAPLGARSAVAVASTELGVFFQDDASGHIWLLPPDGDPQPIGREVESLASTLTISDVVVVSSKRQVRFYSTQGTTLVYDMTHQQWTWFTLQPATSAALVGGVANYITAADAGTGVTAGDLRVEDPAAWKEGIGGGVVPTYAMVIETDWLTLNQLAGYVRHYAALITATKFADCTAVIKFTYKYGTTFESHSISTAGTNTQYGLRLEARSKTSNQRATAIKVQVSDGGPGGNSFGIDGITLTVGIRGKRSRLPTANIAP